MVYVAGVYVSSRVSFLTGEPFSGEVLPDTSALSTELSLELIRGP